MYVRISHKLTIRFSIRKFEQHLATTDPVNKVTCPGQQIHFVDNYSQTRASDTKSLSIHVQDFEYADLTKLWNEGAHQFQKLALTCHTCVRWIAKPQCSNACW